MTILVFKTDVKEQKIVRKVAPVLRGMQGVIRWNFDLNDCDNILRIETKELLPHQIEAKLAEVGHYCKELD